MTTAVDNELPPTDEDSLEELQSRSRLTGSELDPEDFTEDGIEADLPDADVPFGDLEIKVIPKQVDEFTCMSCFLVRHNAQRISATSDTCVECA